MREKLLFVVTYIARLGGDFEIVCEGRDLGPAPTQSVAVLLLGLLADMPDWSDRIELARRLYPEVSRDRAARAFRVALHRLRAWLGEDAVTSSHGRIRLEGSWLINRTLSSGQIATGTRIAPGIHHPWLDDLRYAWTAEDSAA